MKTQLEYFKEVVRLAEENPGMEIHVLALSDEFAEDFRWTAHEIVGVEIGHWHVSAEGRILNDLDDIIDNVKYETGNEITREEAGKLAKLAILVETGAAET